MEPTDYVERTFAPSAPVLLPEPLVSYARRRHVVYVHADSARWCVVRKGPDNRAFALLVRGLSLAEAISSLRATEHFSQGEAEDVFSRVLTEIDDKGFYKEFTPNLEHAFAELRLYLTQGCNLRCRHCYKFAGRPRDSELTQAEMESVVHQHAEMGGASVLISGGEPLLRRGVLFSVLSLSRRLGLKSALLTNGMLLRKIDVLALRDTVDEVQLSLDGPTREIADDVRGPGNYGVVLCAIERLVAAGIKVFLAMTPLPDTIDAFEKHFDGFVRDIRSRFGERVILRMSRALEAGRNLKKPSRSYARQFERRVVAMQGRALGDGYGQEIDAAFYEPGVMMTTCGMGRVLAVESDGNVYPCDLMQSQPVGNVRAHRLRIIADRLQAIASEHSVNRVDVCRKCDLRYLCGGTCRLEGKVVKGRWVPDCSLAHKHHLLDTLILSNRWRYESIAHESAEQQHAAGGAARRR